MRRRQVSVDVTFIFLKKHPTKLTDNSSVVCLQLKEEKQKRPSRLLAYSTKLLSFTFSVTSPHSRHSQVLAPMCFSEP